MYRDSQQRQERTCPKCNGTGRCFYCRGSGIHAYHGSGRPHHPDKPCSWCHGTGVCQYCKGTGRR